MEPFEIREPVVFENHGQKLFGVVHRPISNKKTPMVLMCHGFGGSKTGKYRVGVHLAEELAKVGIASFRFDFRGSGDSEGRLSQMTLEGEISDASVALDLISSDESVDQSRIGLFGRSLGGAVGIQTAARTGLIHTIAVWAPVYNGDQWLGLWEKARDPNIPLELKKKWMRFNNHEVNLDFLQEFFSMKMEAVLESLRAVPFLNIHGEQDQIIDISHAKQYQQQREHASCETKMLFLPQTDHVFSNEEERNIAIQETVSWFQHSLMGISTSTLI